MKRANRLTYLFKSRPIFPVMAAVAVASILAAFFGMFAWQLAPRGARYPIAEPVRSYYENSDGSAFFGAPITPAYAEDDQQFQLFERALLSAEGDDQAQMVPLGLRLELGQVNEGISPDAAFEAAYTPQLGRPLGDARPQGALLIQDFENARLLRGEDGEVRLAELGYFFAAVFEPAQTTLLPTQPPVSGGRWVIQVSIGQPTLAQGQEQSLYVVARDAEGAPLAGANVLAMLYFDGARAQIALPLTDEQGLTAASFAAPPASAGSRVLVRVFVLFGETFEAAETTYTQWW